METTEKTLKYPDLKFYGIKNAKVNWNLSPEALNKLQLKKAWERKPLTVH